MLSISLHLAKPSVFGLFLDREASDRACFGVAHLEYRRQPGDLQDFLKLAAQVAELERSALGLGVQMRLDQGSQLSAVDVLNVIHIKDEFSCRRGPRSAIPHAEHRLQRPARCDLPVPARTRHSLRGS